MSVLSTDTIEWSLAHFHLHSDTDIFDKPFEYVAINDYSEDIVRRFKKQDICQWVTRPCRRCLVPKHRYGFRVATQLDPLDMIFYFSLFLEIGEDLEKARIPADDNISFSYRFSPTGSGYFVFNRNIKYNSFQDHCRNLNKNYNYVVITDIADFYPRIYLHRLENILAENLSKKPEHAKGIIRLLKNWNQNVSYGLPVGNHPSRILAEIVIDDVDRILQAEGMVFARFVDDYRIFCNSRQDAYKSLVFLANTLYEMHGLTLQTQKTKILSSEEFEMKVLETKEQKEIKELAAGIDPIFSQIGLDDPYGVIRHEVLHGDIQEKLDGLNLDVFLENQLNKEEIDISMTKYIINRSRQIRNKKLLAKILSNIDELHPVLAEVIEYFREIKNRITENERKEIGNLLLDKLEDSYISNLEYNRSQIISLFANSSQWGNPENLSKYYGINRDDDGWFNRELILALGRHRYDYWFRNKKNKIDRMPEWERRAFIYAASCLPKDERNHWYRAIEKTRHDELESLIIKWAMQNPIH